MSKTAWLYAEQKIENLTVCRILNSYSLFIWFLLDITSQLQNVVFIKMSMTSITSYTPWVPCSDIQIHKSLSVKQSVTEMFIESNISDELLFISSSKW